MNNHGNYPCHPERITDEQRPQSCRSEPECARHAQQDDGPELHTWNQNTEVTDFKEAPALDLVPLYNALPIPEFLSDGDQQLQDLLIEQYENITQAAFARLIEECPLEMQVHFLTLLKSYFSHTHQVHQIENSSILDSGSSRHIHRTVNVTDPANCQSLTGFDGSQAWTDGNGYLPLCFDDALTGKEAKIDIENVDRMPALNNDILSMGQLIRTGYDFHFSERGKKCYGLSPGGAHEIRVDLGSDDILRISHNTRQGTDAVPLPIIGLSTTTIELLTTKSMPYIRLRPAEQARQQQPSYTTCSITAGVERSKKLYK